MLQLDAETIFSVVATLAVSVWLSMWRKQWEQRAAAKDHDAAVARDAIIPECCVGCRSPRAPHPLSVGTFFIGVSPYAQVLDKRYKRSFTFHCCLRCVRPIRSRRRVGNVLLGMGMLMVIACFAFIALLEFSPPFVEMVRDSSRRLTAAHDWDRMMPLYVLVGSLVMGFVLIFAGGWMHAYSPFVRVVDGGGEKIFFHFRSHRYRMQFAQMNGEA